MESFFDTKHLYRSYFKMALPVVLGLAVTLVYNLADTFFIAQTNDTNLIAGVSLCAPVFTALMAFGNIYGQGGSSLISRLLGEVRRQFTLEGHNAELWDETARRFEQVDPLPLELLPADSMLREFYAGEIGGSRT